MHQFEEYDYEAQLQRVFYNAHSYHESPITRRMVVYGLILIVPFILVAIIANEFISQYQDLDAACIAVILNKPDYCNGEKPIGFVAQALHSVKSRYVEECTRYHKCVRFGGGMPNIATVITTAITKSLIVPIRELLLVFSQIAYITQMFITIAAVCVGVILIYSSINYYTIKRFAQQTNASMHYRLDRHRKSELPNNLLN